MSLVAFAIGVFMGWFFVRWERSAKYLAGLYGCAAGALLMWVIDWTPLWPIVGALTAAFFGMGLGSVAKWRAGHPASAKSA